MGRRSAGREKVETGRDGGGEDRMSETEGGRRRSNYIGFAKCVIEKDCEMYFFVLIRFFFVDKLVLEEVWENWRDFNIV